MQITLEQLKEIAKAGYGDVSIGRRLSMYSKKDFSDRNVYVLTDYDGFVVIQLIHDSNYTSIPMSFTASFNHLAAIRKMEELGLIPK